MNVEVKWRNYTSTFVKISIHINIKKRRKREKKKRKILKNFVKI